LTKHDSLLLSLAKQKRKRKGGPRISKEPSVREKRGRGKKRQNCALTFRASSIHDDDLKLKRGGEEGEKGVKDRVLNLTSDSTTGGGEVGGGREEYWSWSRQEPRQSSCSTCLNKGKKRGKKGRNACRNPWSSSAPRGKVEKGEKKAYKERFVREPRSQALPLLEGGKRKKKEGNPMQYAYATFLSLSVSRERRKGGKKRKRRNTGHRVRAVSLLSLFFWDSACGEQGKEEKKEGN